MSIYDIDFTDLAKKVSPPDKRKPIIVAWFTAILKPLQYLGDLWLGDYRTGSSGMPWVVGDPYALGDRVTYKGSAYESLIDANLGNLPTDTTKWVLVQQNFIGTHERVLYNGNVLPFTFAINKYFGTQYRQPNNVSDIFIQVYPKPAAVFTVGGDENISSRVYSNTSSEYVINAYNFSDYFNMTIWVPVAVYNALDADPNNREQIIRNFSDRYIIAGIIYNVLTY
jgi:hypothetical protein